MEVAEEAGSWRVRQDSQESQEDVACKIHVSGYPKFTVHQELVQTFAPYGRVKVERMTNRFAILNCESRHDAAKAVAETNIVNLHGQFLTVRLFDAKTDVQKRQPKDNSRTFCRSKQKAEIVKPELIDLSGDFHSQVDSILARVRLTQDEVLQISTLYSDVQIALNSVWPGSVAMPFGSITTGLGIKTSDADCYLAVPPRLKHLEANFVNKAKRVLQQYPGTFAEILAIPRANTPIVKFFHVPTGTNCDLSFKTPLGAQNSKLITFLLHCDLKLIPIAVIIKYWAKVHGLSGTGKLSNYALTMLLIFYLQQVPVMMLPSVEWLQRDPAHECIVDYWNTGFMSDTFMLPPLSHAGSISELLGGFFEYYSNFNFSEYVVCPYLGLPVRKILFSNPDNLPERFARYKANTKRELTYPLRITTAMCIQDPFEQSRNVASMISGRMASEMQAFFKFAANAYETEKPGCLNFLKIILLQRPKIVKKVAHPEFRYNVFPKLFDAIDDADWKAATRQVVVNIFERIFKLQLGKFEEKTHPDIKKEKEKYWTQMKRAVWRRKDAARSFRNKKMDFLQREEMITEEILRKDKKAILLEFQVTITYCSKPKTSIVAVRFSSGDEDLFIEFGRFFVSIMQTWVVALLKPYSKSAIKSDESPDSTDSDQILEEAVNQKKKDSDSVESDIEAEVDTKKSMNNFVNNAEDLGELIERLDSTTISTEKPDVSPVTE